MAEADSQSGQAELAARATESLLGPNPFIGLNRKDVLDAWFRVVERAIRNPASTLIHATSFFQELLRVLIGSSQMVPAKGDRRFQHQKFSEGRLYRRGMQGYLAAVHSLNAWLDDLKLDKTNTARARFLMSLVTDALAPTNTLPGNPEALSKFLSTRGRSGLKGLRNLIDDMRHNNGMPSQVDKSKFTVGENVACTPGKVVFRNEVLELLQYAPTTPAIHAVPLLLAPPQINKYYVFDLSPGRSLIQHAVANGHQVFAISWLNPSKRDRHLGMKDYVNAIREATNAALSISGSQRVNLLGACAGGITTTIAAAWFGAIGDYVINSLTLLVTVLDTHVVDETTMGLFITPQSIEFARRKSKRAGVLEGSDTSRLFSWLRPNDLIWNYWVNNYLQGNDPPAFDVLFWNNDTTRLPAALHGHFLDLYVDNPLATPGPCEIDGMTIDLSMIHADLYLLGGTTDHITPWKAMYRNTALFGGEVTYVLSNAGHVQCMVNPPGNPKASYFTNAMNPPTPAAYLESAQEHSGSWWDHWMSWLAVRSGEKVPAPDQAGNAQFPPLCDAPGTYVMMK